MPLRVIHTADWHLGQTLHSHDRDFEHGRFLDWLLATLEQRKPDALLIAGDVFDTVNPSAVAQKRYYTFLAEARRRLPALQVIVTAGNHDAGARLEAASPVTAAVGATVVGTVWRDSNGAVDLDRMIVPVRGPDGAVEGLVLAVPFLRPSDVPYIEGANDPYLEGMRILYRDVVARAETRRASECPGAALIGIGHLHLSGADESRDSERRVVVGGAEALDVDAFPAALAYMALGHLHKPQSFDDGRIVYSGSPIPLSFSERTYTHQVVELVFERGKRVSSDSIVIPRAVQMLRVPATGAAAAEELPQLLAELKLDPTTPPEAFPFLEVNVSETTANPNLRHVIDQALQGKPVRLAALKRVSAAALNTAAQPEIGSAADLASLQPEDILREHHLATYQGEPDAAVLQALREIVLATP